ncbi:MAG: bifunctional ornithine acetyltransferase/N-acetylglutamate synthase [Treponema sp.]|jgi:glutamate N-acetyltransferase/amino-acid N-acetyltransferase|nr:bifunctional ornithine acetyltransferase/N-acetylglutamate synthase [Treponema sp.]
MKEITGGVCAPLGFWAGGVRCGIKPSSAKKDLALIYSKKACTAAAMFTTNLVKAAPLVLTNANIADGKLRVVICNSGNANACTGSAGMDAAKRMAQLAAGILSEEGIEAAEVAVASTGVIGAPFPITVVENGMSALKDSLRDDGQGSDAALEAIMTTDTRKKEIAVEFELDGKTVRIGAIAKGSGMMHPNMATMLTFITTDAVIEKEALATALRFATNVSFNRVTIDGDTSTNDMVVIMANGEAKNTPIAIGNFTTEDTEVTENMDIDSLETPCNSVVNNSSETPCNSVNSVVKDSSETPCNSVNSVVKDSSYYKTFYDALEYVCVALARKMARDGEGATRLLTVTVFNACCKTIAATLAKSVASSNLVKAACFGADANWGRVLCALGYGARNNGIEFSPEKTSVSFSSGAGEVLVCKNGESVPFCEEKAKAVLSEEEIEIKIDLQAGVKKASVWGCDLTYDYVKINGDYRS